MAGRITLWGAGELLSSFFSKLATPPDDFYLALITSVAPTPYVSGAEITEPQGGGYQRVEIPNDNVYWSNSGQLQVVTTAANVSFAPATGDWGTIRFWAHCNAQVDGYLYAVGSLEAPLVVNTGDAVLLNAGDLAIALGPFYSEER